MKQLKSSKAHSTKYEPNNHAYLYTYNSMKVIKQFKLE